MGNVVDNACPVFALPDGEGRVSAVRAKALVFADPRSHALQTYLERVAPSGLPVLVRGETGTGKELVARHLHRLSGRKGEFVAVNCGAISEGVAESELFGHEAGAFSGAAGRRIGWLEAADGGTLFLDEIGDLPLPQQVKLLRALQEQEIVRVGGRRPIRIDLRLVTATNVDLEQAVAAGRFRQDLYYRINVAKLQLPPLRERPLDIMPLAEHFRAGYCQKHGMAQPMFSEAAVEALQEYAWPGNIRELENVVQLALLVANGPVIQAGDLHFPGGGDVAVAAAATAAPALPQDAIREQLHRLFELPGESLFKDIEALLVREAYAWSGYNQVRSAAMLGITRNTMRTLLANHGLLGGMGRPDKLPA
ncbi:MAG: sigma-54 dependent transcriptional regulator [Pseudoxanthomonas sp.]